MGRRKIEIKPIRDDRNRSVTFLKRKGGLFKKAHELSVLCSVDVAVVIFGHNKKLYEYSSSDINDIIGRFQYYGGAHEHKGPADFSSKDGGDDDDEDGDIADDPLSHRGTPGPQEHGMLPPHMQNHPGFQHVRHGTPGGSPPIHNGPLPQFQRGPSPLPPGLSRPSSRADQHPGHVRRPSSNLAQQSYPQPPAPHQPTYAYTPNPPFYTPPPNAAPPPPRTLPGHQATYPPAYPQQQPVQQQVQQAFMGDGRRSSGPPAFSPQPPSQPELPRHPSQEHLQPLGPPPTRSPQPQHRPTPSPQPPQQSFASPPLPQPKPLPAHAKHNIFTPIDDSRSMLAQHWGSSNVDPAIKDEGGPRSQSLDVASMHRGRGHVNGSSPRPPRAPLPNSAESDRPQSSNSMPGPPTRSNTAQSDAKRPRLKVQIPSEQSGDEGETTGADEAVTTTRSGSGSQGHQQNLSVVLPPPSPSAGALLSAGAQGPPNPFARPAPPMNSQAHAMPRDETPISALPSRFMSDNLLPSPSTFYPDWNFGRSGDSNMLPSPLNFQTPVANGQGWREEDKKRANEDDHGGDVKRAKT